MSDANTNRWWESFHVIEMADILLDRNDKQLDTTLGFFLRELAVLEASVFHWRKKD